MRKIHSIFFVVGFVLALGLGQTALADIYHYYSTALSLGSGGAISNGATVSGGDLAKGVPVKCVAVDSENPDSIVEVGEWAVSAAKSGGSTLKLANPSQNKNTYLATLVLTNGQNAVAQTIIISCQATIGGTVSTTSKFKITIGEATTVTPPPTGTSQPAQTGETVSPKPSAHYLGFNFKNPIVWISLIILGLILLPLFFYKKKTRHFVYNLESGEGVSSAHVKIFNLKKILLFEAMTDEDGFFKARFSSREYLVVVEKPGMVLAKIDDHEEFKELEKGFYYLKVANAKKNLRFGLKNAID